jgi:hypothetical protein
MADARFTESARRVPGIRGKIPDVSSARFEARALPLVSDYPAELI